MSGAEDWVDKVETFFHGILMGLADIVPGVSGGTIALIVGIYERLIFALKSIDLRFIPYLLRSISDGDYYRKAKRTFSSIDLVFLLPLAAGIGIAFLVAARFISFALSDYPMYIFSFFFGLILASAWVVYQRIEKINRKTIVSGVLGFTFAFIFVGLGGMFLFSVEAQGIEDNLNDGVIPQELRSKFKDESRPLSINSEVFKEGNKWKIKDEGEVYIVKKGDGNLRVFQEMGHPLPKLKVFQEMGHSLPIIFVTGFIAICAMLLPGISGSFIVLFLGQYEYMLEALSNFSSYIAEIVVFISGSILSLLTFSRFISHLLDEYRPHTLFFLSGLMIGALRLPFEKTIAIPAIPQNTWMTAGSLAAGGIGIAVVYLISRAGQN